MASNVVVRSVPGERFTQVVETGRHRCKALRYGLATTGFMRRTARTAKQKRECSTKSAVGFTWKGISTRPSASGS
jgi:hypothetical protein